MVRAKMNKNRSKTGSNSILFPLTKAGKPSVTIDQTMAIKNILTPKNQTPLFNGGTEDNLEQRELIRYFRYDKPASLTMIMCMHQVIHRYY